MQYDIYAFDCGTTNWRIYRLACEDARAEDGTQHLRPVASPECVALSIFDGRHLPAALLLDGKGGRPGYGQNAYDQAAEPERRGDLHDAFKLCIGNRRPVAPLDPTRRYSHEEALTCTRLLLTLVVERLCAEKLLHFAGHQRFYFSHPVHWGRETATGAIEGELLAEFAQVVYACFPKEVWAQVHFVPESEAALASLLYSGHLPEGETRQVLVVDMGGGTTDLVAGRWTAEGLREVRHHGAARGGGLFDADLARYVAGALGVRDEQREAAWPELCRYGRLLKEGLSRQVRMNGPDVSAIKVMLELAGVGDPPRFVSQRVELDRERLELHCHDTISGLKQLLLEALFAMNLRKSDIGQVVLVGGGANLYLVPGLLQEILGPDMRVLYGDPPEETVVQGTVLWPVRPRPTVVSVAVDGQGDYKDVAEAVEAVADGGTVQLGPGEHRLGAGLPIQKPLRIKGEGMDATTVVCAASEYVIRLAGPGDWHMEGITFRHEGGAAADVVVAETDGELYVSRCRFTGAVRDENEAWHAGLRLSGALRGWVGGCRLDNNNAPGIIVAERAHPELDGNVCRDNRHSGIVYKGTTNGTAHHNECIANQRNGIGVDEQAQPVLEENVCQGNKQAGIVYLGAAGGTARRNRCTANEMSGIYVDEQAQPVLEENVCQGNKQAGIVYFGTASGTAHHNGCIANEGNGIGANEQAQPVLEENVCQGNKQAGIAYRGAAGGTAQRNRCTDNEIGGVYAGEQSQPELDGNVCRDNRGSGIVYKDTASGTAHHNECIANEGNGIGANEQAQPVLEENVCQGNKHTGIAYKGTASGTARRNHCTDNEMGGIGVGDQAQPVLEENVCQENRFDGIFYLGAAGGPARRNRCTANDPSGINVDEQAQPVLEENVCQENKVAGITYSDTASGTARRNQCTGNLSCGILITDQAQPTVESNTCRENKETGISYYGSASGTACQNHCIANHSCGIAIVGPAEPMLEKNVCQGNGEFGILYAGAARGTAHDNQCTANQRSGVGVGGQAQPVLEDNVCTVNKEAGIEYDGAASGTARRNQCSANQGCGIVLGDHAQPVLEENICHQNGRQGIGYTDSTMGTARRNQCTANQGSGIGIFQQAHPLLEENTCQNNRKTGIVYWDKAGGAALRNHCTTNLDGIFVAGQAEPHLEGNVCHNNQSNGIVYWDQAGGVALANTCSESNGNWLTGGHGIQVHGKARPILEKNVCRGNRRYGIAIDPPGPRLVDNECSGNGKGSVGGW